MKINAFLVGFPLLAITTSTVPAAFTGWSVVAASGGGFDSYSVYANFNGATDSALNVFAFGSTTYIGTMNALQDGLVVIGAGPWAPHQFETMADSYVTLVQFSGCSKCARRFGEGVADRSCERRQHVLSGEYEHWIQQWIRISDPIRYRQLRDPRAERCCTYVAYGIDGKNAS